MTERPYGEWDSPVDAAAVASGAVRLLDLRVDGADVYWIEARPDEDGRQVLVRWRDGSATDVSPPGVDVRTRVHEYGGAPFAVRDGVVVFSDFEDQRLRRLEIDVDDGPARPLTPPPDVPAGWRYADADIAPDGSWLVCVRETHLRGGGAADVVNEIVAVPTDGSGDVRVLASGRDFYAAPRLDPTGRRLTYLAWDHPDMPWDAAEARRAEVVDAARLTDDVHVAGGGGIAAFQPTWDGEGAVVVATDVSGWFNLERVTVDGAATPLTDVEADIAHPLWQLGATSFAVLDDGSVAAIVIDQAVATLHRLRDGALVPVALDVTRIDHVAAHPDGLVVVAASARSLGAVLHVDRAGSVRTLREVPVPIDADLFPPAEPVRFPTPDGAEAHAFLYRPHLPGVTGPPDGSPPLLVATHGGPTSNVFGVASTTIAYWTTRGFAVVDVNYRGSTGYGRAYRDALKGNWGVHDVTDASAAARHLAAQGEADPDRLAIRGGSAGGYTTLMALVTEGNPFASGASHFGVGDLVALAEDTHKFESHYLDSLVGAWPEDRDRYVERSPLTHVDRLATPVIVLQGSEDQVVPPAQAELIVRAADGRGVPHAYVLFEGEQHGFRRAANIACALESELAFHGAALGFTPAGDLPDLDIVHAGALPAR